MKLTLAQEIKVRRRYEFLRRDVHPLPIGLDGEYSIGHWRAQRPYGGHARYEEAADLLEECAEHVLEEDADCNPSDPPR